MEVESSKGFRVPLAMTLRARLVRPEDGPFEHHLRCPACLAEVRWRHTVAARPHFFHVAGDAHCAWETEEHRLAKAVLLQQTQDWLRGAGATPVLAARCVQCSEWVEKPLPEGFYDAAEMERALPSGLVADVALLRAGEAKFVVELWMSHAVTQEKVQRLAAARMRWVELDAFDVLEAPRPWKVRRAGQPLLCVGCEDANEARENAEAAARARLAAKQELAARIGIRSFSTLGLQGWAAVARFCGACDEETLLMWPLEPHAPPIPNPLPVVLRVDPVRGRCVPVCHACSSALSAQ